METQNARTYEEIVVETTDSRVCIVELNRPHALNAYTTRMCEELLTAIDDFARNDDLRVLVITGAGRAFCSGGDLRGDAVWTKAASRQLGHAVVMREGMHPVSLALRRLDKPTIAMVNGPAVAGGLTLALLCDIRIASDTAIIGDTSGTVGLLPDEGGAWLFPRAMGLDRALRMVFLSETYDANQAKELGLVTEVVAHAQLRTSTLELAESIAGRPPLAVRLAKRMMYRGVENTFDSSLGDAELAVTITNDSRDAQEGVQAFMQRHGHRSSKDGERG